MASQTVFPQKPQLRFEHLLQDNGLSHSKVNCIVQDRRGFMWFGTNEGLNRLNPKTRSFEHYRHDPADPFSLWRNNVQFLFIDRDGDLWVCYERNGFSLLT